MPMREELWETVDVLAKSLEDWLKDERRKKIKFFMNIYYITNASPALIAGLLNTKYKAFKGDSLNYAGEHEDHDSVRRKICKLEKQNPANEDLKTMLEKSIAEEKKSIDQMDDADSRKKRPRLLDEQLEIVNLYMEIILRELRLKLVSSSAIITKSNDEIETLRAWGERFFEEKPQEKYNVSKHSIYSFILSRVLSWVDARSDLECLITEILDKARRHAELLVGEVTKDEESLLKESRSSEGPKRYLTAFEELPGLMTEVDRLKYKEACKAYYAIEACWNNACDFHELKTFMESNEELKDLKKAKRYLEICEYFCDRYTGKYHQEIIDLIVKMCRTRENKIREKVGIDENRKIKIENVKSYLEKLKEALKQDEDGKKQKKEIKKEEERIEKKERRKKEKSNDE